MQYQYVELTEMEKIYQYKQQLFAGIQNVSVENINKTNNRRFEIYEEAIENRFPYLPKADKTTPTSELDELINEYKRIFGDTQKSPNLHSGANDGNT